MPDSGHLLLEVGAGAGRNTGRYGRYERIVLLDYSITQLEQAQARLGKSDTFVYVAADVYHLPFVEALFDAATMIRVLHHMADAPAALAQVREVLRPGAIFLLEFANKRNAKSVLRYWLGKQSWNPFGPEPVEFAALNFDFHPVAVRAWLGQLGFEVQRTLTVSHFRAGFLKRLVPVGVLVSADSLLQWTGEWWQLTPSVFLRARLESSRPGTAPVPADPLALFKCPSCGHRPLTGAPAGLECTNCGRQYPVLGEIYDFRLPQETKSAGNPTGA
jgi:SAM-dependent methyltransferase